MRLSKDYGYHFRGHHDKDNMSESYLGLCWGPLAVQTPSSMHVQFGRPPDFARVTSTGVRLRQKRKQTSYLEGQGDSVSRLITPITHLVTLIIPIITPVTKSPDPPSTECLSYGPGRRLRRAAGSFAKKYQ